MNEHIIQLLQNEDDNNRLLGIHLAVGDGWSVDDIFKWLRHNNGNINEKYIFFKFNNFNLDYYICGNGIIDIRLWERGSNYDNWHRIYDDNLKTLAEYQAKFIELLLN